MSAPLEQVDPLVELARIDAALDALAGLDQVSLSNDVLLEYMRGKERIRRRLASSDHVAIQELERRNVPAENCVSTVSFLRWLLRIDQHEASARVKAAHAAGPRRALTGEPLPPVFPDVAAAQAAGEISERHAKVIETTIDKLPDEVTAEHGEQIEKDLVGYAHQFDPSQLTTLATRMSAYYDPDGRLKDVSYRDKHRELTIVQRPDGSCSGKFEGTAEFAEFLQLQMDAFARRKPEVDGFKDPRTAAQRRHDALLEAMKLNVRAQQLPTVAGVTATIVLTMSAEDFEQRKGLARTGQGALVPVTEAIRMTGNEYRLMNVVIDKTKGITAYSTTARLFTETQRLALAAIDGGCTFPNCPAPPGWCEIDHFNEWANSRRTRIDEGLLGCRTHNVTAKQQGWRSTRINGRAAWVPPPWMDPEQKPRYNDLHCTEPPHAE